MSGIPFGKYQLVKRLARGGMAEVFLARQSGPEGFQRMVAVKRILPHLVDAQDFVRMFLDEARLAAQLSHPNIAHIYDFGKVDEHFFIAMEYVDGVHAGALIKYAESERLPDVLVARIGADACAGLHYAHGLYDADGRALHIVHRDVSPPNLLVSYDGAIKLVDFGIAKAVSSIEQTRPGVVKGKFAYMSPEQTIGQKLDGRSDVFSLAVLLWELLAGRVLVPRQDPVEGMRMLRDGRVPPIERERPDIAPALAAALEHALMTRRDERATALELGRALEEFIKESPSGLGSALELAEWLRRRFPREILTGSFPLVPEPPAGSRSPARPDLRSTTRTDRALRSSPELSLAAMEWGAAPRTGAHPALEAISAERDANWSDSAEIEIGDGDEPFAHVESSSVIVASEWLRGGRSFDAAGEETTDVAEETTDVAGETIEVVKRATDAAEETTDVAEEKTTVARPKPIADTRGAAARAMPRATSRVSHRGGRRVAMVIAAGVLLGASGSLILKQLTPDRAARQTARSETAPSEIAPSEIAPSEIAPSEIAPSEIALPVGSGPTATPLVDSPGGNRESATLPAVSGDPLAASGSSVASTSAAVLPPPTPVAKLAEPPTSAFVEVVTVPPGAQVALADLAPTHSPARFENLAPGRYRIRVSLPGQPPIERTIEVDRGERRIIYLDLASEAE